jgi:negative regulator of sigma E activity
VSQDEVESQLSAMFDGELPAAECELLSRRIDRDEELRARWARYALIGAAMRSEPVATARSGFALRVSQALEASSRPRRLRKRPRMLWNGALAATLVAGVAGVGVSMLRTAALQTSVLASTAAPAVDAPRTAAVPMPAATAPAVAAEARPVLASVTATNPLSDAGPVSYVTPSGSSGTATALRTQLADYIVAHSAWSAPLLRRNVLSELVTFEDQAGVASSRATNGGSDAIKPSADAGH